MRAEKPPNEILQFFPTMPDARIIIRIHDKLREAYGVGEGKVLQMIAKSIIPKLDQTDKNDAFNQIMGSL